MAAVSAADSGPKVLGVMGAMEPEIAMLTKHVAGIETIKINATLTCYRGTFGGKVTWGWCVRRAPKVFRAHPSLR